MSQYDFRTWVILIAAIALALSAPLCVWLYFFLKFKTYFGYQLKTLIECSDEIDVKRQKFLEEKQAWEAKRDAWEAEHREDFEDPSTQN